MEKKQALILALGGLFTFLVYKLGRDTNKIKARDFEKLSKDKKFPVPIKVKTYVSSPYGWRRNPITGARQYHNGIDLPAPTGTPIYSPLSGTVLKNFTNNIGGNQITIESGDVILGYAHLNKVSPLTQGSIVKQGDVIGGVGTTGISTGPHLHFTVRINGNFVNPSDYFTV